MGLLRLWLAIAVVLGHSESPIAGFKMIHASVAVQLFYVVSGFYMGLVLTSKYKRGSYRLFVSNRFLRIYPAYVVVLLATLAYLLYSRSIGHGWSLIHWESAWATLATSSRVFLIACNALVFGQDVAMFLGLDQGGLFLTKNYAAAPEPHVYKLLLIPQAWSLSVELTFYLLVPCLVWSGIRVVAAAFLSSLLLRLYLVRNGYSFDPWNYRFFPAELASFLAGTLACMVSQRSGLVSRLGGWRFLLAAAYAALLATSPFVSDTYEATPRATLLLTTALVLPVLFQLTSRSRIDRLMGELSYPVYLLHILIIWACIDVGLPRSYSFIGALMAALPLYLFVMLPIDRLRELRAKRELSRVEC